MYILIRPFVLTDERQKGHSPYQFIEIFNGWSNTLQTGTNTPNFQRLTMLLTHGVTMTPGRVGLTNFQGLIYFDPLFAQSEARRHEALMRLDTADHSSKLIVMSLEELQKLILQEDQYWEDEKNKKTALLKYEEKSLSSEL